MIAAGEESHRLICGIPTAITSIVSKERKRFESAESVDTKYSADFVIAIESLFPRHEALIFRCEEHPSNAIKSAMEIIQIPSM
jgi:hypothetical protein